MLQIAYPFVISLLYFLLDVDLNCSMELLVCIAELGNQWLANWLRPMSWVCDFRLSYSIVSLHFHFHDCS